MNKNIIFSLVFISLFSCKILNIQIMNKAEANTDLTAQYQRNEQGQPHGEYKLFSSRGYMTGSGYFNNGNKEGRWTFWDSPDTKILDLDFKNDLLNGTCLMWYGSFFEGGKYAGRKKLEMEFKDDKINGIRRTYHPDGQIGSITQFKDGKIISTEAWSTNGVKLDDKEAMEVANCGLDADMEYIIAIKQIINDSLK